MYPRQKLCWKWEIANANRRPSLRLPAGGVGGKAGRASPYPGRSGDFAISHLDGHDANSSTRPGHSSSLSHTQHEAGGCS